MLTTRGWWLAAAGTLLAIVGVTTALPPAVGVLGLTVVAWFTLSWTLFVVRVRCGLPHLVARRVLHQGDRDVLAGWARQPFRVRFCVQNRGRWNCAFATIRDCHSNETGEGDLAAGLLASGESIEREYTLTPALPGVLHFAGVHIRLRDLNGLFEIERCLNLPQTVPVLPPLTDDEGRQRADKRFNTLPPPGTHRLRMPGSGSELLDLRDYRPGDPPKMIAWKPSARRDRLITKEFESEVPVRCVLFLDGANRVRIGREPALATLVNAAAGILMAATANRDLVGVTFFDAQGFHSIAPSRTRTHATALLSELAWFAARKPDVPETHAAKLIPFLEPRLQQRSPELFDRGHNRHTWALHWRPLLDTRWGWLIFLPMLLAPWLAIQPPWINLSARVARRLNPGTGALPVDLILLLLAFFAVLMLPSVLSALFWLAFGLRGYLPTARRAVRRRKRIAAAFAALDADSPAAVERYLKDDDALARRAGRFFSEHHLHVPVRLVDDQGHRRFVEPEKMTELARGLQWAVTRARDNELYVLLADLIEEADAFEPLGRAVKLARSRHHQVMVILVWPADMPIERPTEADSRSVSQIFALARWQRYDALRRRLIRSGATVHRLTGRDTVRTVLNALDRLRGARSRR